MQSAKLISTLSASMLIISAIGILDHVIIMPLLLRTAFRDAWISVILAGLAFLGWIPLLILIMKRSGQQHVFDWMKKRIPLWIVSIIRSAVILELFAMGAMTLVDVTHWAKISYLTETPYVMIVLLFAVASFYTALSGLRAIAIVNGILLPVVILLGFFVTISNLPNKNYSLLMPVMENGPGVILKGMFVAGQGFVGIMLLVFFQHHVKPVGGWPLLITGLILINLTLSPLIGAIAEFGPFVAADLRFPAYEEWRLVNFGHFLEHVDFLSIYQWMVGSFVRISLVAMLIPDVIQIKRHVHRTLLLLIIFAAMIALSLLPISDSTFLVLVSKFYLPFSLCFLVMLSLILVAVSFIKQAKETAK